MDHKIAVVIPCYNVKKHILSVIANIPSVVHRIYIIDDSCPEFSGEYVQNYCNDPRVIVHTSPINKGVGGATIIGYEYALKDGMDIVVKVDGDGQMNPLLIPRFVDPLISGEADYVKGNRFQDIESLRSMPKIRLFGNAVLSLMCKLSSGYWDIFDSNNGYVAIRADVLRHIPLHKVSNRFFFESDMLFRLNIIRAVVYDLPMDAHYADEVSNIKIKNIIVEFAVKHMKNFFKRIAYNYFLRDMSLASIELVVGMLLLNFGLVFGFISWGESVSSAESATAGTVMLSALPVLTGVQLLLSFINYDMMSVPKNVLHKKMTRSELWK